MNQPKVHDFQERLKFSHDAEDLPIWEEVYSRAFPGMAGMVSHRENGFWQHAGIDRSVILMTGKQIFIDEKVRGKDYGDILLEYISNDKTGALGWVCKPLLADYIAYLIPSSGMCHMLPVIQLQIAWERNKGDWRKKYKNIIAKNKGYGTHSCCVPVNKIYPAIGAGLRINFTPFN